MALKKLSFSFYFLGAQDSNLIFFIKRWFFHYFLKFL